MQALRTIRAYWKPIETVESRQLPDGRWRLDVRHKDTLYEEIAGAPGEPNRWITLPCTPRAEALAPMKGDSGYRWNDMWHPPKSPCALRRGDVDEL